MYQADEWAKIPKDVLALIEGREQGNARERAGIYAKKSAKPRIQQHAYSDEELSHLLVDLDGEV